MEKRFTLKDFFLFAAIASVLVALLVAMYMVDRQWIMMSRMRATMQEQAEDLRALRGDLKALDQRVQTATFAARACGGSAHHSDRGSADRCRSRRECRSRGGCGLRTGARGNPPRRVCTWRLAGAGLRGGTVDHHPAHLPGRLRLERAELRAGEPALAQPGHAGVGGAHRTLLGDQRGRSHHCVPIARRSDLLRRPGTHGRRRRVHLRLHHERSHRGAARPRVSGEARIGRSDVASGSRLPVPRALLQRARPRRRHGGNAPAFLRALPPGACDLQRIEGTAARVRTLSARRSRSPGLPTSASSSWSAIPATGDRRRRASTAFCGGSSRTTAPGSPPSATATSTHIPRVPASTRGCATTRRSWSRRGTSSS